MAHVDEWQKDRPEDKFLFSGSDVNTEDTGDSTGFFFSYQSTWKQRLLNLYDIGTFSYFTYYFLFYWITPI